MEDKIQRLSERLDELAGTVSDLRFQILNLEREKGYLENDLRSAKNDIQDLERRAR